MEMHEEEGWLIAVAVSDLIEISEGRQKKEVTHQRCDRRIFACPLVNIEILNMILRNFHYELEKKFYNDLYTHKMTKVLAVCFLSPLPLLCRK